MKEVLQTTIKNLSHDGRGVSQVNGKTIFIDGALAHETVSYVITKKHRQYDEAKLVHVLNAHESRVEPLCPSFLVCGGCSLQHQTPHAQIQHKEQVLLEQLKHFANLIPEKILAPITGPTWHYRRKARLGVKYVTKKEELFIGFREKNSRFLTDIKSCSVLHETLSQLLPELKKLITHLSNFQMIPQIEAAAADRQVALIIRHLVPFTPEDLALIKQFSLQHQLTIYSQAGGLDSIAIIAKPTEDTAENYLSYSLEKYNLVMLFLPHDFTQVNWDINALMIDAALALLNIQASDHVLDLFCGIGNFTLPIARFAKEVVGVEGNKAAIDRALLNKEFNKIDNAQFYSANLDAPLPNVHWLQQKYDKILLDPPRTGAFNILPVLNQFSAKKIVYISCNPATLARDAKYLTQDLGYCLTTCGVMDMFPHTTHVESIALFEKAHG